MNSQLRIDRAGAAITLRGNGRRQNRRVCNDAVSLFVGFVEKFYG